MRTVPTFEMFKKLFVKASGRIEARFYDIYGNISLEEAYKLYYQEISEMFCLKDKIRAFENYLIANNVQCTQSNISESRYYFYNGMKYRFSGHVYPTGSMTNDYCIDFAANPELINNVNL
jgi:hypothetical protein